ncbi:serine hydrolase domain-containing protein [Qipengyuania sp. MTN3-11]|uniref:serine hydrolase domain-containing protein n=1 Tax=Qipengyuania sp. MTN3-11 TaxID=3056557 RepID=UPI0036F1BA50
MAYREFDDVSLSRRTLLRGGALFGAGAALSAMPFGGRLLAQASGVREQFPAVAALVDSYVDSRKVANVVAVMGWGQADPGVIAKGNLAIGQDRPAGLDSLYRIYSMSKPITGMATMMLVDEGKLGLDQPLGEVLPAYANMQVQKTYDGSITDVVPAERPITIRHLLTHTAGIGYNIVQKGPIKDAYNQRGIIGGQVSKLPIAEALLGDYDAAPSLEAFADRLAELPLVYQPGTHWSYSNSIDLLGRVIEVASGQSFESFLNERLFAPTGMDSTWFRVPASEAARLTTNYGVMNGTLIPLDPARMSIFLDEPPFPAGGGGLVSSPRDYDRFLRMLLGYGAIDGKRVMSERAVRLGTSNLLPEGVSTAGTFAAGAGFGAGGRVVDGSYGWAGAAGTVGLVSYKAGLRAALFTQYMPSEAYAIQREFPDAVLKDVAAAALRRAG